MPALRWGVLGTGWIAGQFVRALPTSTTQQVVAVGSRTQASAERFASAAGVPTAHGSPEALVADPCVDVVYVATPHQAHRASALLAIDAGKHVLVEKPMGLDAAQAEEVAAAAATAGVFCMEALWTLFLPRFDVVRQVLGQGCSATSGRCWPTTASGSTRPTGYSTLQWRAGPCSTSAATSPRWRPGRWARPRTCTPPAR